MKEEKRVQSQLDKFKNETFSSREWSAPTLTDPKEIKKRIASFNLEGKTIKKMRLIGLSYRHDRDLIEDQAYSLLGQLDEEERLKQSTYDNISPDLMFPCWVEVDEPLLIGFEDNTVFEIVSSEETEFRFSMNQIPWWIDAGINDANLDANIFFAPCIGKKIVAIETESLYSEEHPTRDDHLKEEHVSSIVLRLDDGKGISVGSWFDYCEINYIDSNGNTLPISFKQLKTALFKRNRL